MNLLDIIILTPLVLALIRGIYKGFINELASLIALLLGIYMAYLFSGDFYEFISKYIKDGGQWLHVLSYILIFAGVSFLVYMISRTLTKMAKFLALGMLNRLLGGLFALAKVSLILLVVVHFFLPFYESYALYEKTVFKESTLFEPLTKYSSFLGNYLGDFSQQSVLQKVHEHL